MPSANRILPERTAGHRELWCFGAAICHQLSATSSQPRSAFRDLRSAFCVLYPIKKHRLSLYEQSLCFFLFLFLPGRSGIILVPFIVFGQNGCEIRDQPPAVSRGSRMAGRGPQVAVSSQPSAASRQQPGRLRGPQPELRKMRGQSRICASSMHHLKCSMVRRRIPSPGSEKLKGYPSVSGV